jgi:hypothetical protein
MMPGGFGGGGGGAAVVDKVVTEKVMVDPMTEEEMSKTYDLITAEDVEKNPEWSEKDIGRKKYDSFGKEKFIARDTWFRIQAKFAWKGAPLVQLPTDVSAAGSPVMKSPGAGTPAAGAPLGKAEGTKKSGHKKKDKDIGL